jgi:hypothetical protein
VWAHGESVLISGHQSALLLGPQVAHFFVHLFLFILAQEGPESWPPVVGSGSAS